MKVHCSPIQVGVVLLGLALSTGCDNNNEPTAPRIAAGHLAGVAPQQSGASARGHNPAGVFISDAGGLLYDLDLQTLDVTQVHRFADDGSYDIQYARPFEIFVANYEHDRIDRLNLRTKELQVMAGPSLGHPIGVAVSPRGVLYVTDHEGRVLSFNLRTNVLDLLADHGPDGELFSQPDGIVVDPHGRVFFSDHAGRIYGITPWDKNIVRIATFPGAELNGMALLTPSDLVVASTDHPPALYRVNVNTGEFTVLHQGSPFRNPEDVAVDPQHKEVYVLDSDFKGNYPPSRSAIFVYNLDTGELETLWASSEVCCGLVDILLRTSGGGHY